MIAPNYTTESKYKSKHHNNYTDVVGRDTSNEKTDCHGCIFVGENEHVSKERLCAERMREIAEVKGFASCDKGKPYWKWYNQINPIKKWLLERSGFVFKNR